MKQDADRDPLLSGKMRGRLERLQFLARLALFWERLWPALWPAVGVGGIFLALALFDVLPGLPGWLHFLVLIAFLGLLGFALRRAVMSLAVPGAAASRRRLETKSGLEHRPLSVLGDELATGENDPEIRALWHLHQKRMFERLRNLRVGAPAAGLAKRDLYALRAALTVVLAIAAAAAWNDGASRLARAVTPDFASFGAGPPATLDVWITPPAYTGLAPIFVKGRSEQKDVLAVPAGSGLLAQLHGGRGTPRLKIDDEATPFSAVDTNAYKITATSDDGDRLSVEQDGKEIAAWPLSVIPRYRARGPVRHPANAYHQGGAEARIPGGGRLRYRRGQGLHPPHRPRRRAQGRGQDDRARPAPARHRLQEGQGSKLPRPHRPPLGGAAGLRPVDGE